MIVIVDLLSSWTIVGDVGGYPNFSENWRNHIIVFDASNSAKYSASVDESANNFAILEIVIHDPEICLNEWIIHNVTYVHRGMHMRSWQKHGNLYQIDQ